MAATKRMRVSVAAGASQHPSFRAQCIDKSILRLSSPTPQGLAVHRPILIGSTATPLTPAEKLSADPLHTHKWTVAVRSAASNPLPTHVLDDNAQANNANTASASATSATPTIGTRGRDTETDYHKHVGGKDDISHFVRRVQFKLHDSFPQPVRTCDRPPYQVTETGWGEFEVQIKIFWVTESAEKPLQTFHYLKLHPWNPLPVPAPAADAAAPVAPVAEEAAGAPPAAASATDGDTSMAEPKQEPGEGGAEGAAPAEGQSEQTGEQTTGEQMAGEQPSEPTNDGAAAEEEAQAASAPAPPPAPALPPVVHSWQYDEIVFPEPTEAFYQTLIAHPPTP